MSDERPVYIREMMSIINKEQRSFRRFYNNEEFDEAIKNALKLSKAKWTEKDVESVKTRIVSHAPMKRVVVENLAPFIETLRLLKFDDTYNYGENLDAAGPAEWIPNPDDNE